MKAKAIAIALVPALLVAAALDAQAGQPRKGAGARDDDPFKDMKPSGDCTGDKLKKLEDAVAAWRAARKKALKEGAKDARRDLENAARSLRLAAKENPKEALPLAYLGYTAELQGDDRRALKDLKDAAALAPGALDLSLRLAGVHVRIGEHKAAEAIYEKLLVASADNPHVLFERARERTDAGRYADALADLKKAGNPDPMFEKRIKFALDGPPWANKFEKESENYVLRTDIDSRFAEWASEQVEKIRKLYMKVFAKMKVDFPKRKYTVVIFATDKEYHEIQPEETIAGHYDPETRQLFLFRHPKDEDTLMVLFHEGFHQFLHQILPDAPQWLNEGLADYFGAAQLGKTDKDPAVVGPNWWRDKQIQRAVKGTVVGPLKEIFLMSQEEFYDEGSATLNYAQAWSFIYYLVESGGGSNMKLLAVYFDALKKHKTLDEAMKAAFGEGGKLGRLEEDWRTFILGMKTSAKGE